MDSDTPVVRPELTRIAAYNAGLTLRDVSARYGVARIAKLGSNENPHGPSPTILAGLSDLIGLAKLYPDPQGRDLAAAISTLVGVPAESVVLGNGSEDLIAVICRTCVRPGDRVVTLYPSFPLHEDYVTLMGGVVERVSVRPDLAIDIDALLDATSRAPRMVMIANPMNPVGSRLNPEAFRRLVKAVPSDCLLVVDEAYLEYAAGPDYPDAIDALTGSPGRWTVLRTLSKAYGLAGFRIGFAVTNGPELAGFLNRARTPFNTNAVAQAAGVAALRDREHLARTITATLAERARVSLALQAAGWRVAPSKGNFLFFDVGRPSVDIAEALLRRGVIVKPWKQPGFETFIRVSIGDVPENDQFLEALSVIGASPR